MMNTPKVILYISMSLDGFIATHDDDLSWLSIVQKEGLDYGYGAMQERCDFYIVGRKTYDIVLGLTGGEFPQAKMFDCYILSRNDTKSADGVTFYGGDLKELIQMLKDKNGKDIYCDGGSQVVKALMAENLIDEFIISIVPIVLGDGIKLFQGGVPSSNLKLLNCESFETGLVQLQYERIL
jgi:dihydrofolate reductase